MNHFSKSQVLFLFTKEYPYRRQEKYIDHELPFLAGSFEKVVIVPTELFTDPQKETMTSELPPNVSVYDYNGGVRKSGFGASGVFFQALGIWIYEFVMNRHRRFLVRYFRKNFGILLYQLIAAKSFAEYIKSFPGAELYFYTYWLHHSSLMLASLVKTGVISGFVTRAHSIDLYNEDWAFVSDDHKPLPYACFKLKHATRVYAISEHGRKYLAARYSNYNKKIAHAYLGVPDNGERAVAQVKEFTVVTCSSYHNNKRIHLVPEILSKLDFDVRWIHFGSGGDETERVMKAVAQAADNVKIDIKGSVPNSEVIRFYRENDVHLFVNLSKAEGVPVSIMEALSFGIPSLATAVFGTPELLEDGSGFLIKVETPTGDIAQIISDFRNNSSLQEKMRKAARATFLNKLNAGKVFPEFVRELKNAARGF